MEADEENDDAEDQERDFKGARLRKNVPCLFLLYNKPFAPHSACFIGLVGV